MMSGKIENKNLFRPEQSISVEFEHYWDELNDCVSIFYFSIIFNVVQPERFFQII